MEDVGIVLGGCFLDALGDKRGIVRYADATVPLDEALVRAVVDVTGGRSSTSTCRSRPISRAWASSTWR